MKKLFFASIVLMLVACVSDDPVEDVSSLEQAMEPYNKSWNWIEKDDMFTRLGETMGYAASLNKESKKFVIFLEGGGACFNGETCFSNPSTVSSDLIQQVIVGWNTDVLKLFSRSNEENAFKDWNHIYVPYATGDVHSGVNADADVPLGGPEGQKMVGYNNVSAIIKDLKEYAKNNEIDEILVSGSSAGGFGVYLNFIQIADAFPSAKMTGLVDSGPIFLNDLYANCIDSRWNSLWKLPLPDDYSDYVTGSYTYKLQGIYEYLSKKYPNADFGFMSTYEDLVIQYFYGFSVAGCQGQTGYIGFDAYKESLLDLQSKINGFSNWKVYYVEGFKWLDYYENQTFHTFLRGETYENISVDGKKLVDWVEELTLGNAENQMD